jgi:EAL and modified HD-GYP domain-containing signal transduction protein
LNSKETLLASQPIYTPKKTIYSCTLFFERSDTEFVSRAVVGEEENSEVFVNLLTGITDIRESANIPIFLNIAHDFIADEPWVLISPKKLVLVISTQTSSPENISGNIQKWRRAGYRFALDSYNFDDNWSPLIGQFAYLFIDMELLSAHEVIDKFFVYKKLANHSKWIAAKVGSEPVFETCVEVGFDLFQGRFLANPKAVKGKRVRPAQVQTLELLRVISQPETKVKQIANIVATDPKLTFQLLKIINSPLYHLPRTISSLQQAIMLLGMDVLKRWAYLVSIVSACRCDQESCRLILVRARTCELASMNVQKDIAESAFLMGLLSGADLMLEIDKAELFKHISVTADIQEAILSLKGSLGGILNRVLDFEHRLLHSGDFTDASVNKIAKSYAESTIWVNELLSSLKPKS